MRRAPSDRHKPIANQVFKRQDEIRIVAIVPKNVQARLIVFNRFSYPLNTPKTIILFHKVQVSRRARFEEVSIDAGFRGNQKFEIKVVRWVKHMPLIKRKSVLEKV